MTEPREHPILFSSPMVRAIQAGRKTQTRRILKPQPGGYQAWQDEGSGEWFTSGHGEAGDWHVPLRWRAGDHLWVRERWSGMHVFRDTKPAERESFVADGHPYLREDIWYWADDNPPGGDWEPPRVSIHMPRWASRITLEVVDLRVERLQDITEADARAEGVADEKWEEWRQGVARRGATPETARERFSALWDDINGPGAWDENPWVSATTFRVVKGLDNA